MDSSALGISGTWALRPGRSAQTCTAAKSSGGAYVRRFTRSLLFRGCKFYRKAVGDLGGYKGYVARGDGRADGPLRFT